jgi:hypothetical protein
MFEKILTTKRGDNGRRAAAAKPDGPVRALRPGGIDPMERSHV